MIKEMKEELNHPKTKKVIVTRKKKVEKMKKMMFQQKLIITQIQKRDKRLRDKSVELLEHQL